jgi:hypothetical protein
MTEKQTFDQAMKSILRASPKAVKAAVDAEIQGNTAEREARGEKKRGRKPKSISSASGHASSANS